MPVIIPAAPDSPLMQGDLLKNVTAYTSLTDGIACPWPQPGLAIVLSRNCAASRDKQILVASVSQFRDGLNDIFNISDRTADKDAIKKLFRAFSNLRDGHSIPNNLYIGEVKGIKGRAAVQLNRIATIEIPEPSAARTPWITERRLGTLSPDYRRHLQIKLFTSLASEGFAEPACFSDQDLLMFITTAQSIIALAEADQLNLKREIEALEMTGDGEGKKSDGICKQYETAKERLATLTTDLEPYLELRRDRRL